jgi:hypothetical protein
MHKNSVEEFNNKQKSFLYPVIIRQIYLISKLRGAHIGSI